jgi:cell division initiation protein
MLTPLDIESKEFNSVIGGYSKAEVKQFMKELLFSYERLYKDNIEMKDKINMLNEGIQYYKTIEETLQNTLILAERTSEEVKATARIKAETIEKEAEINASRLIQEAKEEIYTINQMRESMVIAYDANKIQIKQFLLSQLEMITKNELELDSGTTLAEEMLKRIKHMSTPKVSRTNSNLDNTLVFESAKEAAKE